MTLADDARRLLGGDSEPYRAAQRFSHESGMTYWFCGGAAPMADGHAPDCPWLRRQQIGAVLEAAERLRAADAALHDRDEQARRNLRGFGAVLSYGLFASDSLFTAKQEAYDALMTVLRGEG